MLWLAARLKEMGNYTLRVNTNGLADCITGRNAAPEMHGLLDIVSVSLNMPAEDIEACRKLCENAGAKFRVREYISE